MPPSPDQLADLTARVSQREPEIESLIAQATSHPTPALLDQLLAAFNEGRELACRIAAVRSRLVYSSQFAKSQIALNQSLVEDSPQEPLQLHG